MLAYRQVVQWWDCHLSASGQASSAAFPVRMMERLYICDPVPRSSLGQVALRTGEDGVGVREVTGCTSLPLATQCQKNAKLHTRWTETTWQTFEGILDEAETGLSRSGDG